MVQAKGMRPLDSRLSAERQGRAKYSTSARSRTKGLSAAKRAIPTRVGVGLGGIVATEINGIENLPEEDKEIFAFYSPIVKR
jgi:hypothetical protein